MFDFSLSFAGLEVSYFASVLDTVGKSKPLQQIFDLIYSGGKYVSLFSEIRALALQGDKRIKYLKMRLPAVSFSCETDGMGRKEQNIHKLHPLICLDFDAKDNPHIALPTEAKQAIINNPYVVACFVSPSGSGLKVLVRTKLQQVFDIGDFDGSVRRSTLHYFRLTNKALAEYFIKNYGLKLDPHSASPIALNSLSYDKDLFVNPHAVPFSVNESLFSDDNLRQSTPKPTSFSSKDLGLDNVCITGKVNNYEDWYKVGLGLANEYGEAGRSIFHSISQQSAGYNYADCDRRYTQLLRDNQGKIGLGTLNYILGTRPSVQKQRSPKQEKESEEQQDKPKDTLSITEYLDKIGFLDFKKGRGNYYPFDFDRFLIIAKNRLQLFSCEIGASMKVLHVKDNKLHILEKLSVLQVICDYIKDNISEDGLVVKNNDKEILIKRGDLINSVFHWKSEILHDATISMLPNFSLKANVLHSSPMVSYKFYNNGVLCIDGKSGEIELKSYDFFAKQGLYVFQHEILQRDYLAGDATSSEVARFVDNISGSEERSGWCRLLLGYLAHNYTADRKKKAVIFSDSQNIGQEAGRTGKGLLGDIVRYQYEAVDVKEANKLVAFIDGKNFNSDNKFKYQRCTANTRLILLEDIKDNHNIQQHFNELLVGFNVERKNLQPFIISSKLILTTNYSMPIEGTSSKDRFWEFSLLPYYSNSFTPAQDFGAYFFSEDWTQSQWANYDAFMHSCIIEYFNALEKHNGNIPQLEDKTNLDKKLEDLVGIEFLDFADNIINPDGTLGFQEGTRYYRRDLLTSYCEMYPRTKIIAKKFVNKVRQFKKYHPDWQEDTIDKNGKRAQEGQDSRGRFIIFVKKN